MRTLLSDEEKVVSSSDGLVDLRIYQGFPLEDLTSADAADFVREAISFDLILCSWTLFHLCDPLGSLLQLRRFLDKDGVMLVNGAYLYFQSPSAPEKDGSVELLEDFCEKLSEYGLESSVRGRPIRWVQKDEMDAGDYEGGYLVSFLDDFEKCSAFLQGLCDCFWFFRDRCFMMFHFISFSRHFWQMPRL